MSPLFVMLELFNILFFDNVDLVVKYLYRFFWIFSFFLAIFLFKKSIKHTLLSFTVSIVFFVASINIHHNTNPLIYDIAYPFFSLLHIYFLFKINTRRSYIYSFLAGLQLAFLELTRPFIIYLLPFFILYVYLYMRRRNLNYKFFLMFLVPIFLFSGMWHFKLMIFNNGQINWSNYSGYNLYRCWGNVIDDSEKPDFLIYSNNLKPENTNKQAQESKYLIRIILTKAIKNPFQSLSFIIERVKSLTWPKLSIYSKPVPSGAIYNLYKISINIMLVFILYNFIMLVTHLVKTRRGHILFYPENFLTILILISILVFSVGESSEEARFIISVLPLLATIPVVRLCRSFVSS